MRGSPSAHGPGRGPVQRESGAAGGEGLPNRLGRYIDVVLTSDQFGVAKPGPRVFALACGRLGVPPQAAVYVGDRLRVDAIAATASGLRGIWLNPAGGAVPPGVEAIDDLTELPSLLGVPRLI